MRSTPAEEMSRLGRFAIHRLDDARFLIGHRNTAAISKMKRPPRERPIDADVQAIDNILESYQAAHPSAEIRSYRQNSACIRIRIIDPAFQKSDRVARDNRIWKILRKLPEDVQSQITMVLLLTPDEATTSFANMEFDHPIPSRL